MRIIKASRIREFSGRHPSAAEPLRRWLKLSEAAHWNSLVDVRKIFRGADEVKVRSGRNVVVFNIKGNDYRLITAIHYDRGKVFTMLFLTHAEYSKDTWKDVL